MPDFTSVPTVELLTRAADAARKAAEGADWGRDAGVGWYAPGRLSAVTSYVRAPEDRLITASGPDHWRAIEAMLRAQLKWHQRSCEYCRMGFPNCDGLTSLRPLAEQVLQHLGDTE